MKRFRFGIVIAAALTINLISCNSDIVNDILIDPIDVKVITTSAEFDGYYVLNGEDVATFYGGPLTSGVSTYEKTFDDLNTIEVGVTTRSGATSVRIQIYKDMILVKELFKEDLLSAVTENLSYTYNEEPAAQN